MNWIAGNSQEISIDSSRPHHDSYNNANTHKDNATHLHVQNPRLGLFHRGFDLVQVFRHFNSFIKVLIYILEQLPQLAHAKGFQRLSYERGCPVKVYSLTDDILDRFKPVGMGECVEIINLGIVLVECGLKVTNQVSSYQPAQQKTNTYTCYQSTDKLLHSHGYRFVLKCVTTPCEVLADNLGGSCTAGVLLIVPFVFKKIHQKQ